MTGHGGEPTGGQADGPAPLQAPHSAALELRAGALRLALRPDLGAAIAGLWCGNEPVLRSTEPAALAGARDSGGFVLAPYSNRLGWRRFHWQGQDYRTAPNTEGSPHSLHGVAFLRPWAVLSASDTHAELLYDHRADAHWPFAFTLQQRIELQPNSLRLQLSLRNTDARTQPAGLGWHPYFHRRARSRLHIDVGGRWVRDDATQLPTHRVPQPGIHADVADLAFDHCFDGWQGAACLDDELLSLKLTASLPYLVVFTPTPIPGRQAFYCVEPVSHVNNALQMADPAAHGLRTLAPGEVMGATFTLNIRTVQAPEVAACP